MEMEPISYSLKDVLVRQGIEAGRAGNTGRHGIGAGLPGGTPTDPLADAAAGGPRIRSGMEKDGAAKPRQFTGRSVKANPGGIGIGFDYVVHTNHAVPTSTRKRTVRVPFLVLVK